MYALYLIQTVLTEFLEFKVILICLTKLAYNNNNKVMGFVVDYIIKTNFGSGK